MDLIKIGKFIAECRKNKNLTQLQLAEALFVSDRAVSKWENGRSLPDSSIMLNLCQILDITVNDLLSGEKVSTNQYNQEMENNLLSAIKEKEAADKHLLRIEIFIGVFITIVSLSMIFVAAFVKLPDWLRIVLIVGALLILLSGILVCLRIEQKAGYYVCQKCGHRYVPSYQSVLFAMHTNRSRYMKCPKCGKRSWHKKELTKTK